MNSNLKPEIYSLVESIEDENVLQMVKEDIAFGMPIKKIFLMN